MNGKFLESERLFLKPLSFQELYYINNNEIYNVKLLLNLNQYLILLN